VRLEDDPPPWLVKREAEPLAVGLEAELTHADIRVLQGIVGRAAARPVRLDHRQALPQAGVAQAIGQVPLWQEEDGSERLVGEAGMGFAGIARRRCYRLRPGLEGLLANAAANDMP